MSRDEGGLRRSPLAPLALVRYAEAAPFCEGVGRSALRLLVKAGPSALAGGSACPGSLALAPRTARRSSAQIPPKAVDRMWT
jgi:hypothetical protein